jgi:integrase
MPQDNVKTRKTHIVYLSCQALALFSELRGLAGRSPWVLPGREPEKPIGMTTLNQVIYIAKKKSGQEWLGDICIHDLRRTASTHLHEMGWDSDVIEKALNHAIGGIRGVYNRAQYAEARREMLQAWANYLDGMESGGNVVPLRQQG